MKRQGFTNGHNGDTRAMTLIELLIVVALIAIFVAGSGPMFLHGIRQSRVLEIDADLAEQLTFTEYALVRDLAPGTAIRVDEDGRVVVRSELDGAESEIVYLARDNKLTRYRDGAEQVVLRSLLEWQATEKNGLIHIDIAVGEQYGANLRRRATNWVFATGEVREQ